MRSLPRAFDIGQDFELLRDLEPCVQRFHP